MEDKSWTPQLNLLNPARINQIHKAATEILENTGLNIHHEELRSQLKEAGAQTGGADR